MTGEPDWVPPGVDTKRANAARIYDYLLGGSHNFLADQDVARALAAVEPNVRLFARANREFLGRAVRFLGEAGIRQFLDIGSGIPTEGNVHQVAQRAVPGTRVVYADIDPVAVAHSKTILAWNENAAVIQADLRDPEKILTDPATERLIDFSQPAGLLLVSVLPFIADAAGSVAHRGHPARCARARQLPRALPWHRRGPARDDPGHGQGVQPQRRHPGRSPLPGRTSCVSSTASGSCRPGWSIPRSGGRTPPMLSPTPPARSGAWPAWGKCPDHGRSSWLKRG